jgi:hypothetical protein
MPMEKTILTLFEGLIMKEDCMLSELGGIFLALMIVLRSKEPLRLDLLRQVRTFIGQSFP